MLSYSVVVFITSVLMVSLHQIRDQPAGCIANPDRKRIHLTTGEALIGDMSHVDYDMKNVGTEAI